MFDSGPHVSCYTAVSKDDETFTGVRCILFANFIHRPETAGVAFVWYAEGVEASGPYRHFGEAFITGTESLIAHAAPIVGNGERDGSYLRLRFDAASGPAAPTSLTLDGDRREKWTLVPDGVVPYYRPMPRHIERTGPTLNEYAIRSDHGTPGFGVRSTLTSGSWLGAGHWLDRTYLHLGTYIQDETGLLQYGAADILGANFYCGSVPWGEFTVRDDPSSIPPTRRFTGAWSEHWELRHPASAWTPDPAITRICPK
jgi:hypothetical protein